MNVFVLRDHMVGSSRQNTFHYGSTCITYFCQGQVLRKLNILIRQKPLFLRREFQWSLQIKGYTQDIITTSTHINRETIRRVESAVPVLSLANAEQSLLQYSELQLKSTGHTIVDSRRRPIQMPYALASKIN